MNLEVEINIINKSYIKQYNFKYIKNAPFLYSK